MPPLAGRGERLLAVFIDLAAYLGVELVLYVIGRMMGAMLVPTLMGLGVLGFVGFQFYWLTKYGQTIGKASLGIRVVLMSGAANGGFVPNVLLRVLVNGLISLIPLYALVDVCFIFREDRRCIHDLIAGTAVVKAEAQS